MYDPDYDTSAAQVCADELDERGWPGPANDLRELPSKDCIGEFMSFFCGVLVYTGKVVATTKHGVQLKPAKVVFETGSLTEQDWQDAQPLPTEKYPWTVKWDAMESYGEAKPESVNSF